MANDIQSIQSMTGISYPTMAGPAEGAQQGEGGRPVQQRGDGVERSDELREDGDTETQEETQKRVLQDRQRELDNEIRATQQRLMQAQENGDQDDGHAKTIDRQLQDLQRERDDVGQALMQLNGGGGDEGGGGGGNGGGGGGIGGMIGGLVKGLFG